MSTEVNGVLRDWYLAPCMSGHLANGNIYGDTKGRFPDGMFIHTSLILSGPDENGVIVTRNSSYRLEPYPQSDGLQKAASE